MKVSVIYLISKQALLTKISLETQFFVVALAFVAAAAAAPAAPAAAVAAPPPGACPISTAHPPSRAGHYAACLPLRRRRARSPVTPL